LPLETVRITPHLGRRATSALSQSGIRWGKDWGKKPHRLQPIPADLDLVKTA
jgi:hypothetical protein